MSVDRARLWMRKAENDLLAADNNLASRHIPCDVVCFHCQQAAEKLLKGLLLSLGAQPLRTHDLLALLEEARRLTSIPVPDAVASACHLSSAGELEPARLSSPFEEVVSHGGPSLQGVPPPGRSKSTAAQSGHASDACDVISSGEFARPLFAGRVSPSARR